MGLRSGPLHFLRDTAPRSLAIAGKPPKSSGAYSIRVPFRREGRVYTFKKLKGDAGIGFLGVDRGIPKKALNLLVIGICGIALWGAMALLSAETTKRRLRRTWPYFAVLPGLFLVPYNPVLGVVFLLAWLVFITTMRRLKILDVSR